MLLEIDPAVHNVQDIPFTQFIRRQFHLDDLMTYFHEEKKVWVVGGWVDKVKGLIKEFIRLGPSAGSADRKHVDALANMLSCEYGPKEAARDMWTMRSNWLDQMGEIQHNWNEQKAELRRMGFQHPCLAKGHLTE